MRTFKVITLLFISFSLIFGNFANAAMLCCAKNQSVVQMQMDSKSEMPCCHKAIDKTDKKVQPHKSCANCKNCVSINAIIFTQPTHYVTFSNVIHSIAINSFVSVTPENIYSPPKYIS